MMRKALPTLKIAYRGKRANKYINFKHYKYKINIMSLIPLKSEKKEQVPAGSYVGRCYSMIHIGTIVYQYQGETVRQNKLRISFELPNETKVFKEGEEAKPYVISKDFTFSLHEKSRLRPFLEAWRGKAFTEDEIGKFDVEKLISVPAFINIIHSEKGYAEITSASQLPKGLECLAQVNPTQILTYDNWNEELYQKLPNFLKEKIASSEEFRKMKGLALPADYPPEENASLDSSIPF